MLQAREKLGAALTEIDSLIIANLLQKMTIGTYNGPHKTLQRLQEWAGIFNALNDACTIDAGTGSATWDEGGLNDLARLLKISPEEGSPEPLAVQCIRHLSGVDTSHKIAPETAAATLHRMAHYINQHICWNLYERGLDA